MNNQTFCSTLLEAASAHNPQNRATAQRRLNSWLDNNQGYFYTNVEVILIYLFNILNDLIHC